MTDNEIIKALERCIECNESKMAVCNNCPLEKTYPECDHEIEFMALTLINRQKAEILELREIVFMDRSEAIKNLKAEAVKEFVERLCEGRVSNDPVVIAAKCLQKEMTEESDGKL